MYKPLTGEMLEKCLDEAAGRLYHDGDRLTRQRMAVYSWPQQWSNSACGFGGVAMQAFWVAPTIVVVGPADDVCVFHAGRFVAHLRRPSDEFSAKVREFKLPGAIDAKWWAAQETDDSPPPPAPPE
jgi:hypothetical protein